ncbi:hypothetical protein FC694_26065 [Bacillus wiedmannii]|uniref:Uncharacterized protein n=1 Tax=Bacillus wiedmannii TaxID=1890302 RepID=A0A4U2MHG7_9BACI|nr:hypothetical protein FC694_26065 [Bacillus wiedmannii]
MFRKKDLTIPFGVFSDRLYRSGVDIAAWLNLLSKGKLLYIPDPLSQLRLHSNNISKDHTMKINAVQDLIHLLFHGQKHNFLKKTLEHQKALKNIYQFFDVLSKQLSLTNRQQLEFNYYALIFRKLFTDFGLEMKN